MSTQTIQTRIITKHDEFAVLSSQQSTFIPLKGELVLACIPLTDSTTAPVDTRPTFLAKVGDGEHNWATLPYLYAAAVDVYGWAKLSEADFVSTFLSLKNASGKTLQTVLDDLFATPTEVATAIQSALIGLDLANTYAPKTHSHTVSQITDLQTELNKKVDVVEGKGLSTNDLTDELKGHYDTAYTHSQTAHAPVGAQANVIEGIKVNGTLVTLTDKVADITVPTKVSDLDNDAKYLVAADVAEFETKANVKVISDELATVKATAEAATTVSEVDSQIEAKITALNLDRYTTEQEVKDIVDGVIASVADSETMDSLTELVDYIEAHGGEATEMAGAISTLESKVATIEAKPAQGITSTQISNWDNEVGAKALAETKLDASEFTSYSNAHAGDYTNNQIDDAIDADVKTAIETEIARADGKYEVKDTAQTIFNTHKTEEFDPLSGRVSSIEDLLTGYGTGDADDTGLVGKVDSMYTNEQIDAKIDSVIGTSADAATANTVFGAKKHADDAIASLATVASTGNFADLIQTSGTYIIFDCGSASKNI